MATILSSQVSDGFKAEVAQGLYKIGRDDVGSLCDREDLDSGILGSIWRISSVSADSDFWVPSSNTQALLAQATDPMQPKVLAYTLWTKIVEAGVQDLIDGKAKQPPEPAPEAERLRVRATEAEAKAKELEEELQLLRAQNERNAERLSKEGHPDEDPPPASRATGPRPRRRVA